MASGNTTPPIGSGNSTPSSGSGTNTPASSAPSSSGSPAANTDPDADLKQAEAEEDDNEIAALEAAAWPDASEEYEVDDPDDNTKKIKMKKYYYKMSANAQNSAKEIDGLPIYYTYTCNALSPNLFKNLFTADPKDSTKLTPLSEDQKKAGLMFSEAATREFIGIHEKNGGSNKSWSYRGDGAEKRANVSARDPRTGDLYTFVFFPAGSLKEELRNRFGFQSKAQTLDTTIFKDSTSWEVCGAPINLINDPNYTYTTYQQLASYVWYQPKAKKEDLAPVGDKELYIRLLSRHVQKIGGGPMRMYLHKGYFEKLTTTLAQNGNVPAVIKYRDAVGKANDFKIVDDYGRGIGTWNQYYADAISQVDVDRGGKFPRAIDPSGLTIYIKQMVDDKTMFGEPLKNQPQQTLEGIFESVEKEKRNIVVEYEFVTDNHDKLVKDGYHLLSISPFQHYSTYILATQFATYLECNENREMFTDIKDVRNCGAQIKPPAPTKSTGDSGGAPKKVKADYEFTRTQVDSDSIEKARKTERKTLPDQGVVMGKSATYVADYPGLEWDAMRKKTVTTREFPTKQKDKNGKSVSASIVWPKQNFHPSEWLHRSAYSFGGTTYNTPITSQSGTNLVFGTSETNSVMTRYEESIKTCLVREKALEDELWALHKKYTEEHKDKKDKFPPPSHSPWPKSNDKPHKSVFGNVVTKFGTNAPSYEVTKDTNGIASFKTIEVKMIEDTERNKDDEHIKDWAALSRKYPWHCTDLEYNFTLARHGNSTPSLLMNVFPGANHHFYPFMRPFFTRLEGAVDDRIITVFSKIQTDKYKASLEEIADGGLNTNLSKLSLSSGNSD